MPDLEVSKFQKRPAYRYIRQSDNVPSYAELFMGKENSDPIARIKLFNPTGAGTWYIAAYDPADRIAWGIAEIHEREIGDFSMAELVDFRGRFGLPIERDLFWEPRPFSKIR